MAWIVLWLIWQFVTEKYSLSNAGNYFDWFRKTFVFLNRKIKKKFWVLTRKSTCMKKRALERAFSLYKTSHFLVFVFIQYLKIKKIQFNCYPQHSFYEGQQTEKKTHFRYNRKIHNRCYDIILYVLFLLALLHLIDKLFLSYSTYQQCSKRASRCVPKPWAH